MPKIMLVIRPRAEVGACPDEAPLGGKLVANALRVSSWAAPAPVLGVGEMPPPIMIPFVTMPFEVGENGFIVPLCFHCPGEVEIGGGAGGARSAIS